MDNKKMNHEKISWWSSHKPSTRRWVQLYSALLYNAHLKGFISGQIYTGKSKYACVPGFNCYSCPGAVGACPLGAIQNALGSMNHHAGWYILGIILLYGVIAGRTICGWLCPLGLFQELLNKIPAPRIRKSLFTRALSYLKYILLVVFVGSIPLWYSLAHGIPLPGFCKYICPAGTLEGAIVLLSNPANENLFRMLGILFTRKFVILLVIVVACIFCYRSFCRFLCPLGAIYGLFNRLNLIGVRVDQERCNSCGSCVAHCPMDVREVGDHECIQCGKCMEVCAQGAISMKAASLTLKAPKRGHFASEEALTEGKRLWRLLWGIALLILAFALVWFNFLDPDLESLSSSGAKSEISKVVEESEKLEQGLEGAWEVSQEVSQRVSQDSLQGEAKESLGAENLETRARSYESEAPEGFEQGQQLADFSVECYDGSTFSAGECRGKIVFINLWATYCTPCVNELPYFNDLYLKHRQELEMVALHATLIAADDPVEFWREKGYQLPFATATEEAWSAVGGSMTLPQTIVLNRRGEVIYNEIGSVTPEALEALYQKALESTPE